MPPPSDVDVVHASADLMGRERSRRLALGCLLAQSADGYIVTRGQGRSIIAGYPWFTDWGRDTFIALRGLCFAGGRDDDARDMIVEWAGAVSDGMLPNRFPDAGEQPEYNSVDASLWFVVAVGELLARGRQGHTEVSADQRARLIAAVGQIVAGYARGTRYGIRADADGLLQCGEPGSQLTWMDARVDGRPITPRIGKPVEIQALWINALAAAADLGYPWSAAYRLARRAFVDRFWDDATGMLADVVDVDHVPGSRDDSVRRNQIFAVGGLPLTLLPRARARRIVDGVERELLTPVGLRSLSASDPRYAPHYTGGPSLRDAVYHQGTVWPWLLGPFVEAWLRVRGNTRWARMEARRRFVAPLLEQVESEGLGHLAEIADADAPHALRGCPAQAWSLGELMRIERLTNAESLASTPAPTASIARPTVP